MALAIAVPFIACRATVCHEAMATQAVLATTRLWTERYARQGAAGVAALFEPGFAERSGNRHEDYLRASDQCPGGRWSALDQSIEACGDLASQHVVWEFALPIGEGGADLPVAPTESIYVWRKQGDGSWRIVNAAGRELYRATPAAASGASPSDDGRVEREP